MWEWREFVEASDGLKIHTISMILSEQSVGSMQEENL